MMRVPNLSIYTANKLFLGNLASGLQDANEVVSTQKRINSLSDDPLGLTQTINLKSSINNLVQAETNINLAKTWLSSGETSLSSINSMILDAKTSVSQLINASSTSDERNDAMERVNNLIREMVSLGNSQINGSYLFSGTDIDTTPLLFSEQDGVQSVTYQGGQSPFQIQTDKNATIDVGRDGSTTFWDSEVAINESNNTIVFKQDNGHGDASEIILTATVAGGEYTPDKLRRAVQDAVNEASAKSGYGVTYQVNYDARTQSFSMEEDGTYPGYMRTEFMWANGGDAYLNTIRTSSGIDPDSLSMDVLNKDALTAGTPEPQGTRPMRLVWDGKDSWSVENNPGYDLLPSTLKGTASQVGVDLDGSGTSDILIHLSNPVVNKGDYIEFDIIPAAGDHSIGHEMGFKTNDVMDPITSDAMPTLITDIIIGAGVNDTLQFVEVDNAGVPTPLTATLTPGTYTDMNTLAQDVEAQMEAASAASAAPASGIDYTVSFDAGNSRFIIGENGTTLNELHLEWSSSAVTSATAKSLGFYPLDDRIIYPLSDTSLDAAIVIGPSNDTVDFREITGAGSKQMSVAISHGTYTSIADLETAVGNAMTAESVVNGYGATYTASYDALTGEFTIQGAGGGGGGLTGLHLLWGSGTGASRSIAGTLGFDPGVDITGPGTSQTGSNQVVLMTFDATNNAVDFVETATNGISSEQVSVRIPEGDYTDLADVAAQLQSVMRAASPNSVQYSVSYDDVAGKFLIKGSNGQISSFSLLWNSGTNASQGAAGMLGFAATGDDTLVLAKSDVDIVNITVDGTNNRINFKEILPGLSADQVDELTATVETGVYTSMDSFTREIEKALEAESRKNGNGIDYSVTYNAKTKRFSFKESGNELAELDILWGSGSDSPGTGGVASRSMGSVLGFDNQDDKITRQTGDGPAQWGIFNTLIDLNTYLNNNDTDGLERTLLRLETNFDKMTSRIADIGLKYNRAETRLQIGAEVSINLKERRSSIEDADFVQSVMDLKALELAYEAALSSTSRVLNISLVDYLQ
ncbi:MAG: flagellar hook-associated protein FlgL [Pseudomonadota bacterium]